MNEACHNPIRNAHGSHLSLTKLRHSEIKEPALVRGNWRGSLDFMKLGNLTVELTETETTVLLSCHSSMILTTPNDGLSQEVVSAAPSKSDIRNWFQVL